MTSYLKIATCVQVDGIRSSFNQLIQKKEQRRRKLESKFDKVELEGIKQAFGLFDRDGTGQISNRELRTVIASLGKNPCDRDVKVLLQPYDENRSDCIEWEHFLDLLLQINSSFLTDNELHEIFNVIDTDRNDEISRREVRRILRLLGNTEIGTTEIEEMFEEADKDGDGYMNFEEFCRIINS